MTGPSARVVAARLFGTEMIARVGIAGPPFGARYILSLALDFIAGAFGSHMSHSSDASSRAYASVAVWLPLPTNHRDLRLGSFSAPFIEE